MINKWQLLKICFFFQSLRQYLCLGVIFSRALCFHYMHLHKKQKTFNCGERQTKKQMWFWILYINKKAIKRVTYLISCVDFGRYHVWVKNYAHVEIWEGIACFQLSSDKSIIINLKHNNAAIEYHYLLLLLPK